MLLQETTVGQEEGVRGGGVRGRTNLQCAFALLKMRRPVALTQESNCATISANLSTFRLEGPISGLLWRRPQFSVGLAWVDHVTAVVVIVVVEGRLRGHRGDLPGHRRGRRLAVEALLAGHSRRGGAVLRRRPGLEIGRRVVHTRGGRPRRVLLVQRVRRRGGRGRLGGLRLAGQRRRRSWWRIRRRRKTQTGILDDEEEEES